MTLVLLWKKAVYLAKDSIVRKNNPKRRFSEFKTKIEICSLVTGTYEQVSKAERYLLKFIEPYKQNYFILTSGNTETYSC